VLLLQEAEEEAVVPPYCLKVVEAGEEEHRTKEGEEVVVVEYQTKEGKVVVVVEHQKKEPEEGEEVRDGYLMGEAGEEL
jgi:hypothetical protein